MSGADLPAEAYATALAGLPGMGHRHLRRLLGPRPPAEAWEAVLAGRGPALLRDDTAAAAVVGGGARAAAQQLALASIGLSDGAPVEAGSIKAARAWREAARRVDVAAVWTAHREAGVAAHLLGSPGYPDVLADDGEAPAVIFVLGDLARPLALPAAAIIGSRRCTHYGREVARELGRDLAAAGVSVVSGLAAGIDGAAHVGALEPEGGAPPVGVVGSGLDVVYPRRHAELWRRVAERGALVSEVPLGTAPAGWRFPARNRIIATLARVVVVVEAHARSGSTHTVDAADNRGRRILAVPGPVRSPASAGPNALLAEGGREVARDAADVLMALGLAAPPRRTGAPERPKPSRDERAVLDAVGWQPASLEQVASRVGAPLGPVSLHLEALVQAGWLRCGGAWWERVP